MRTDQNCLQASVHSARVNNVARIISGNVGRKQLGVGNTLIRPRIRSNIAQSVESRSIVQPNVGESSIPRMRRSRFLDLGFIK